MFEYQYAKAGLSKDMKDAEVKQFTLQQRLMPLMWGEHCIECSAPECYFTCKRYEARADGHCRRFERGIEPVVANGKLGARVIFKPWAKLEAKTERQFLDGASYLTVANRVSGFGKFAANVAKLMPGFTLKSKCQGAWEFYRTQLLKSEDASNEAVVLRYSIVNESKPTSVFFDLKASNKDLLMREKIDLPLGRTESTLSLDRYYEASVINIHPADVDARVELIFEELEVIPASSVKEKTGKPKKVKCVIWDLDNTLWDGVLIESEHVEPKPEFIGLIKKLDARGIVNSIASKNNEEQVLEVLEKAGIADLFVFKKINWEPKSQNIQKTIKGMNINPNTFVFVDDNPYERDEVKSLIPDITCVDPSDILSLAETERFDVPISEESAKRRETYKMLEQLNKEQEAWTGNIDSFLISCHITLTVSKPTENNVARCYELLQRTNQLNSSGRRLSMEELLNIINSDNYNCYVMESSDKFGSYGIVGFMIVDLDDKAKITDFVISCRVANKKIEPTLINYLAQKYGGEVLFDFKKTKLNGPMKAVIDELKMEKSNEQGEMEEYIHKYNEAYPHIVTLTDLT